MTKAQKHVVYNTIRGRAVKNSGATRASKVFPTQVATIDYGHETAKKSHAALFVHAQDGTIPEQSS
jgi:hypothetical protein